MKALPDAKACIDQQATKPDKAADAANKAVETLPNDGLAELLSWRRLLRPRKSLPTRSNTFKPRSRAIL